MATKRELEERVESLEGALEEIFNELEEEEPDLERVKDLICEELNIEEAGEQEGN
jgi:hydrogenase maturation factor HypF (carbamoyltransferase family)